MTKSTQPRTIDHLVLPVADVNESRARYEALGFTVAPTGLHPFGTENCCIFFKDGTFLEPLGIAQREICEEKAIKGNTFVANDQAYRFRQGVEGFSHMVLKSDDAKADHKLFKSKGMSGGKKVKFSRDFETPSGEKGKATFLTAFASDVRSPDSDFFTCQVVNAPSVDRSALQIHANGVVGLKEIILSESNPTDFQYFFQTYLNQREMDVDSFGMSFETQNTTVTVLSPDGIKAFHGIEANRHGRGMLFEAFVLATTNMAKLKSHFDKNNIDYVQRGARIMLTPARGQATHIIFEEMA